MAGAGYKLFNTGDVLTAAQVNTYLQEQVVMVFANAAARTTALSGVLAEGMVSYLKDTDALEIYSGAAWVGYGSGDITGITTGATSGLTGGVTSGTADLKLNTTAKGGLLVGTGSGAVTELAVGSNNTILTADSSTASGLKWATASGSGGMTLLSTTSLSGTSTTISSISNSYKHLFVYVKGVYTSGNNDNINIRFNSDTGANYNSGNIRTIGTTLTASMDYGSTAIQFMDRTQSATTVSRLGSSEIYIYRYTDTDFVDVYTRTLSHNNTDGLSQINNSRYDGTAAISSITFFSANAFTLNGTVYIYGVN